MFFYEKKRRIIEYSINPYFLEKLIEREVFKELIEIDSKVSIVSGIPHFRADQNPNYYRIVSGVSEINERRLHQRIRRIDRYIDLNEFEKINFMVDLQPDIHNIAKRYTRKYGIYDRQKSEEKANVIVLFAVESEIEDFDKVSENVKSAIL